MPCTQGISAVTVPLVYVYGEERFINITCAVCCYSWQAVKLPQPWTQWAGNSGRMWRSWRCSYLPWTVNRRERKRYGERGIDRKCYELSRIKQIKCNQENLRLLITGGKSHYQSCASLSHFFPRTPKIIIKNIDYYKTYVTKPQSFWENVLLTDETKVELFGKGHGTVYRKEMRPSQKRTQSLQSNMVEVQRCFGVALLLLALDALTVWNGIMKSDDYQIILGCNVVANVRKLHLHQRSWVFQQDNDPKHTSEMVTNKALESSDMASNESRSESHRTPVERSQNSSWEKASFKSEWTGAVC